MHAPIEAPYIPDDITVINIANLPVPTTYHQLKISDLVQEKINSREYFYGIEISPGWRYVLNYNLFKIAPLFTSIVWIASNNLKYEQLNESPALRLAGQTEHNGPVLVHLSCQNLTETKLQNFLSPNVRNVMAIRGDIVDSGQRYRYAADLVRDIREVRKDDICISVGGYPEVHPEAKSKDQDLQHLKEKVDAGADIIITQLTFSTSKLIDFIRECRKIGITIPILPGIFIPRSYASLKFMCDLTKVYPSDEIMAEYVSRKDNRTAFQDYAVEQGASMIQSLFNSDLNIYGVQFFTTNYFKNIQRVVQQVF